MNIHNYDDVDPCFHYQFRLIVIGDSMVGKSSLLKYLADEQFSTICDPTIGVDFSVHVREVEPGVRVKLQLWDTAGQERFRYESVMIVFDVTKRMTFENIDNWIEESKVYLDDDKVTYLLIGHKCDLGCDRVVSRDEASRYAEFHGFQYIETSAKTGKNVQEAFDIMAKSIYNQLKKGNVRASINNIGGIKEGYTKFGNRTSIDLGDKDWLCSTESKCCT